MHCSKLYGSLHSGLASSVSRPATVWDPGAGHGRDLMPHQRALHGDAAIGAFSHLCILGLMLSIVLYGAIGPHARRSPLLFGQRHSSRIGRGFGDRARGRLECFVEVLHQPEMILAFLHEPKPSASQVGGGSCGPSRFRGFGAWPFARMQRRLQAHVGPCRCDGAGRVSLYLP